MRAPGSSSVYFHPGTTTAAGIAQIGALSQSLLSIFPPGMHAPNIVDYNAANVPVAQLNVFSDTLSEQQLFDYGLNFIRVRLYSIEGISVPSPFGGRNRARSWSTSTRRRCMPTGFRRRT